MERVAAEGPRAAFDQSQAGFISQQTACGQRVCCVQAWRVQCGAARKRGETGSDEPAAHGGDVC